jgi:hypothetical protein
MGNAAEADTLGIVAIALRPFVTELADWPFLPDRRRIEVTLADPDGTSRTLEVNVKTIRSRLGAPHTVASARRRRAGVGQRASSVAARAMSADQALPAAESSPGGDGRRAPARRRRPAPARRAASTAVERTARATIAAMSSVERRSSPGSHAGGYVFTVRSSPTQLPKARSGPRKKATRNRTHRPTYR